MKTILVVITAVLLSACASMGQQGMTAEQIAAVGKEAAVACTFVTGSLGYSLRTTYASLNQNVIRGGGVVVNPDCTLSITNTDPSGPLQSMRIPNRTVTGIPVPIRIIPTIE